MTITWGTLTIQIGWPIATRPAVEHGSGQISSFFHLLDLAIVNSYNLLSSCGGKKISHRDFRPTLIREMLARSGYEPRPSMPVGRPAQTSTNIGRLDTSQYTLACPQSHTAALSRVLPEGYDAIREVQVCQV